MTVLDALPFAGHRRQSGLPTQVNDRFGWTLLAFVSLSPLPLASNRPFFWAMTAVVVSILAIFYFLALAKAGRRLCFDPSKLTFVGLLAGLFAVWHVVQMAPLWPLTGGAIFRTQAGDAVDITTISIAPAETWFSLLRFLSYAILFFLCLQVGSKTRRLRLYLTALLLVVTGYALYGLVALVALGDTILFMDKWAYLGSATGTFVNRNAFATFLGFGSIIGVTLSLSSGSSFPRTGSGFLSRFPWFHASCTVIILSVLLATQSRMGVAATVSGIIGICAMAALRTKHADGSASVARTFAGAIALLLLIATPLFLTYGTGLLERFAIVEHAAGLRAELYRQVIAMIGERPWTGYGGGTFALAFPLFHQPSLSAELIWDRAHSTYLELWSGHGLVMGSVPMLILLAIAWRCLRLWFRSDETVEASLVAVGVMIVATIHALVDFSLEIQANAVLFTALLAFGLSKERRRAPMPAASAARAGTAPGTVPPDAVSHEAGTSPSNAAGRRDRERLTIETMPAAVYAVGDVHGCLDLLVGLEAQIVADAGNIPGDKLIILLGDMIDRGPSSAQVIDHLLRPPPQGFRRICIAGNHEQMMLDVLDGRVGPRGWLDYGGIHTLASYGMDVRTIERLPREHARRAELFGSFVPDEHVDFLRRLPVCVSVPGYCFVHGGLHPGVPLDDHGDDDLMTVRLGRDALFEQEGLTLVHGHTPLEEPLVSKARIGLDTEAFRTGRLTAARIGEERRIEIFTYSRPAGDISDLSFTR